jgi:ABC-type transport system substrate-binding protein
MVVRMKNKSIILFVTILLIVNSCFFLNNDKKVQGQTFYFDLNLKVYNKSPYIDYAKFVKEHLARIGININIILENWFGFIDTLQGTRDFDLVCAGFGGGGTDYFDLPLAAFTENGSLNCYGYHTSMDWDESLGTGFNEWYIREGNTIIPPDSEERIQYAWDWQDYMQNWIVPMKPLFAPQDFIAYWSTLEGFSFSKGILDSWGAMKWNNLHSGQESTHEIIIADYQWSELNPFFRPLSDSNKFIIDACLDTLFHIDNDLSIWPHLAKDWNWINEYTLDISIRPGIKWHDYGSFINEYLDANDVYFTFYCNKEISVGFSEFDFIKNFEKIDDMTIRFHIDGNPSTPEPDPYASTFIDLATWIVPEHFLNQTQEIDGITPDTSHPSWREYATNVWGTDLYMIDSHTEGVDTILKVKPDSWRLDLTLTNDSALDYERRFGNYLGNLDTLKIRIFENPLVPYYEFEKGRLDLVDVSQDFDRRYKYKIDQSKSLQSDTSNFFIWLGFNMRPTRDYIGDPHPAPLDPTYSIGLAIRKAIAYAINRAEINEIVNFNESILWDYPNYPTLGMWNNPNIIRYNFNLNKARELLTKVGYDFFYCRPPSFNWGKFMVSITVTGSILVVFIVPVIIRRAILKAKK